MIIWLEINGELKKCLVCKSKALFDLLAVNAEISRSSDKSESGKYFKLIEARKSAATRIVASGVYREVAK
jgi:hypothetical protein